MISTDPTIFNVYLNYFITRGYMKIRENKGIQDMSLGHFNIYNKEVGGILTKKERDKGGDRGWEDWENEHPVKNPR